MKAFMTLLAVVSLTACHAGEASTQPGSTASLGDQEPAAVFQEDGALLRPRGYREWIYVGAPLTPNDMNQGKAPFPEFHSVYIDRPSYDHYKQHGSWRDGTVLVKELVTVGSKSATSGQGYFMGSFAGLEVSVKDSRRFPEEPGAWAFFRFTDEKGGANHRIAQPLPTAACAGCHRASAADDLVFTQYYPVLTAARAFGPARPEDQ